MEILLPQSRKSEHGMPFRVMSSSGAPNANSGLPFAWKHAKALSLHHSIWRGNSEQIGDILLGPLRVCPVCRVGTFPCGRKVDSCIKKSLSDGGWKHTAVAMLLQCIAGIGGSL